MEYDCTLLPIPNDANSVNTANAAASFLFFRRRSKIYIGPPANVLSALRTRYLMER